jgi:uncharacterized membrane protein
MAAILIASACAVRNDPVPNEVNQVQGARVGDYVIVEEPPPGELPAWSFPKVAQGGAASACLTQDGEALTHKLKALGTEPFWAAEVEGRCVTYKTPEDQPGTRVWTRVDTGPQGPVWNGALRGRQFQLIVKPAAPPGCSDGMSDKTYPMDALLRVDGETRNGCAEPL